MANQQGDTDIATMRMEDSVLGRLVIDACVARLRDLRQWVGQRATTSSLSARQVEELVAAVDEAASNAIRHASLPDCRGTVRVECRTEERGVTVDVYDQGDGFRLPTVPTMPGTEATGGRGLPLMFAMADFVEITPTNDGTRVTLVKLVG